MSFFKTSKKEFQIQACLGNHGNAGIFIMLILFNVGDQF